MNKADDGCNEKFPLGVGLIALLYLGGSGLVALGSHVASPYSGNTDSYCTITAICALALFFRQEWARLWIFGLSLYISGTFLMMIITQLVCGPQQGIRVDVWACAGIAMSFAAQGIYLTHSSVRRFFDLTE